jgi:outer membrane protein insertion porin family
MIMKLLNTFALITLATGISLASSQAITSDAHAQTSAYAAGEKISDIKISGNQRIEGSAISSFLGLKTGEEASSHKIDEALALVYKTGLFADVSITVEGSTLNVEVVENPIIGEVAFEGNDKINTEDLTSEVQLSAREVYTKTKLQNDVKRILTLYQRSGRFATRVEPKVIQLDQNRVNLVFEIEEGDSSQIERISFVGNNAFSSTKLRHEMATKESRWYRFFSGADTFDPDRIEYDKELLRRYYVANGYADFKVLSASSELTPEKESFIITFTIEEGKPYSFGKISATSELPEVESAQLEAQLTTEEGTVYNATQVEDSIEKLTEYLGGLGYAFVNIEPQYVRNSEESILGISYAIKEGPRVYIENININGNDRTLDEVIRREFRLAEGDPFNTGKIKRSEQRIQNLGFFKDVKVRQEKGSAPDRVNIEVDLEEQSTGELTFGAGFSTSDGALGDIGISERNLLGKGQSLKLNFTLAAVRQEVDLSFTEPHFLGRDIKAGFDLFKVKRNGSSSQSNLSYDNDTVGGVLRAAYPLTEHLTHSVRYSYRSDDITDIDSNASTFIQLQEGKNSTSLVGHSFGYDKRDNRFEPSEGYFLNFSQDIAGLGGDNKFFRNEARATYYYPVYKKDLVLKIAGRTGHIFGYDDEDVRINDRFFVGSNEIRGFANEGIGPRDSSSLDPLGGNTYWTTSAELTFPLGLPEELGLSGSVFMDAGSLFDSDDSTLTINGVTSTVRDESSIRAAVGVGVGWKSPLGPIRIDIAAPFAKEDFDETENVKFSFGTRF